MIGTPYALALAAAIGLAAGWTTHGWLTDSRELERINAQQIATDAANRAARKVAADTSAAIAGIRIEHKTVYNKAVREVIHAPVFRDPDCRLPAESLGLLNQARTGTAAGSVPAGAMPSTPADPGRQ